METFSSPTSEPSAGVDLPPAAVFRADGTRLAEGSSLHIQPVDFRNPACLPEVELRRLRSMHDEFERAITSRLSSLLRSELALKIRKLETQPFETFVEGLKNPSQISLFRVNPLNGIGFVEIPPKLAVALTTRILGGREPAANADPYLTEIEIALLEDVIAIVTGEWCEQWRDETAMNAHLIGHETNPKFLQAGAKNAMMLVVSIDLVLGRCEEVMQIAVPLSMIEPIMKRLSATRERENASQRGEGNTAWRNSYDDIAIPVHAEIAAARMTVAALLKLKTGEIIELPASALETTRINIAGGVSFTARAGQKDGCIAVEITKKL